MKKTDKRNIEEILALTPMQEGMLFHYLKNPDSHLYFEQLTLGITGEIDVTLFEQAWNVVVETNEMLRAVFRWENVENPVLIILKEHRLKVRYQDVSGLDTQKKIGLVEKLKAGDRKEKFCLKEVPFRVMLCKFEQGKYLVIISNHHIIYDGWSNGIILNEFVKRYSELSNRQVIARPVKRKYREFIRWSQNQDTGKQEEFWKEYLVGVVNDVGPPVNIKRKADITGTGAYRFKFRDETDRKIVDFVKKNGIPLSVLLYSAWGILLQEYNDSKDVLFDATVSGRSAKVKGIETMVGLFINTLPVRVKACPHEKIIGLLQRMNRELRQWEEHENTPLAFIKEYLPPYRPVVHFDSVVVIENYPLDIQSLKENSEFSINTYTNIGMTGYDLTVLITTAGPISVEFTYNNDVFNEKTAALAADHFVCIVEQVIKNPRETLAGKEMLPRKDVNQVLQHFNSELNEVSSGTGENNASGVEYAAPRDGVEEKLAAIWTEVLRISTADLMHGSIGIDENFFDFGGHSLKASLLTAKLHREFKVKIPLAVVFEYPTIRELASYIRNAAKDEYTALKIGEEKQYYELSSVQKRMYALHRFDRESTAYNVSSAMIVEGGPDKERLEDVFKRMIRRYEIFRTSFEIINDRPVQRIHPGVEFKIECYDIDIPEIADIGGMEELTAPGIEVDTSFLKNVIRPFDLSCVPLLRVALIGTGEARHLLVLDMHHIITDGVSMDVFIKEFTALYTGAILPVVRYQYKDFSQWQYERIKSGKLKQQEKYWLKELSEDPPVLNMQTDFPRPSIQSFAGDRLSFYFQEPLTRQLYKLAKETGTTLFMLVLTALNILLSRYSGQEDIMIGTTAAGREHVDLGHIIGLFFETLVLRNYPVGNKVFHQFLNEVRENTLKAFENQSYPFRELMKQKGVGGGDTPDFSRNPLFNVMLIVQNVDMAELAIEGLTFTPVEILKKVSRVDLTMEVFESENNVRFDLEYSTELFRKDTIQRLAGHFLNILHEIVNNPGKVLSEIEVLGGEEKQHLLEELKGAGKNPGALQVLTNVSTQRLFEEQVKQRPDGMAIVYEDWQLTYRELAEKAGSLSKIIAEI